MNRQTHLPCRHRRNRRAGQVLIMFVAVFALMSGAIAVALDGGRIYWERRTAQNAADSGAIAGAHELKRGNDMNDATVQGWVKQDAQLYGYSATEIDVDYPPSAGAYVGDDKFVAVEVTRIVPLTFMRIFGRSAATVKARAVAGLAGGYGQACVIALDNNASKDAFKVNGSMDFQANCGLVANSTDADAMRNVGTGTMSGTFVGVTGGYSGGGTTSPTPVTGVPPVLDPLADLPTPSKPSNGSSFMYDGVRFYRPGAYNSEISITGGDVVFLPGMYYLEKGLKITGGNVWGNGVFFYNENTNGNRTIDIGANATVRLAAPTTGTYKGVLFFNNRESPYRNVGHKLARGNMDSWLEGSLYFPSQHLDWAGNPETVDKWSMVVAYTLNVSGTTDKQVVRPPDDSEASPFMYTAVMFQ